MKKRNKQIFSGMKAEPKLSPKMIVQINKALHLHLHFTERQQGDENYKIINTWKVILR